MSEIIPVTNDRASIHALLRMAEGGDGSKKPPLDIREKAPVINPEQRWLINTDGPGIFRPSDLTQKKGWEIRNEMVMRDPLVRTFSSFLIDAILSSEQHAKPVQGKRVTPTERIEFCESIMECCDERSGFAAGWDEGLGNVAIESYLFGVSISEMCLRMGDDLDPWPNKVVLSRLKDLNPKNFRFNCDANGNLLKLTQFPNRGEEAIPHDPKYFVIFPNEPLYGNLWGRPILDTVYMAYFARQIFQKSLNVFVEKQCLGQMELRYPDEWGFNDPRIDSLLQHAKAMHGSAEWAFPKGVDIKVNDFNAAGFSALMDAIDHYSSELAIGLKIPMLLFTIGSKTGSYALVATQMRALRLGVERRQRRLSSLTRGQIFAPFMDWNFGRGVVPLHQFDPIEMETLTDLANYYGALANNGLVLKREALARKFKIDPGDLEDREMMVIPKKPPGASLDPGPEHGVDKPIDVSDEENETGVPPKKTSVRMGESNDPPEPRTPRERRMDLRKILAAEESGVSDAASRIAGAVAAHVRTVKHRLDETTEGGLRPLTIEEAADIAAPLPTTRAAILQAVADMIGGALANGAEDVRGELIAAIPKRAATRRVKQAEGDRVIPLPREVIERIPLRRDVQLPYSRSAFNLSGEIADDLLREGERFFDEMLVRGASLDEMTEQLDGLFSRWIESGSVDETPRGNIVPLRAAHRLENIVRTEYGEAYNGGRLAIMFDPDVTILVGVEYSAVLDSRTTKYCKRWDGVIFDAKNVDAIARYGSPAHYQCRAIMVPVTIYDQEATITPISRWPRDEFGRILEPMPGFGATRRRAA